MKFADVKNDIAFRKIFGNENRKEVLISFLNAVLDFEGEHRLTDVTILNPYQLPKFRDGKATIIDVKAQDQSGREFIIEMQVAEVAGFSKRVLYYTARGYTNQIERGEFYQNLNPVIFIGILDFDISKSESYISRHRVRDVKTGEELFEDFEFNIIELQKFGKKRNELSTLVEKWVFFIKEAENLEVIPEGTDDEGLRTAYEEANIQTWTKQELEEYDYASMREQDERGRMEVAVKKAEKTGEERGEKKSLQKVATEMKRKGIDLRTISEITGLSIKEIEDL